MHRPKNHLYTVKTGIDGAARLDLIHLLYGQASIEFYKRVGLSREMCVLDIGCGKGNTAIDLARFVGPNGKVVGIDISYAQIELAKAKAESHVKCRSEAKVK